MWRKFCGFLLKIWGWTPVGGTAPDDKCILLGAPHTSIWDFVVAYLFYKSVGGDALCMVKEEFFKWPVLGWIIRKMGGIPVNRKNPSAIVLSVIREMEKREKFHLAIAPEGTRKPVRRWKAGFHIIAKETGVPVYISYFDWGTKRVGIHSRFEITDDAKADMARIQEIYESMHLVGKYPKDYITR